MKLPDAIRVLLVDDSAVIRGALGGIIDAQPDMRVVTTAHHGRAALEALKHTPVEVVLLDIEMPECDGLTALPQILSQYPATRVIMASSLTRRGAEVTMQALALGASDFIAKPAARHGTAALAALAQEIAAKVRAVGRSARATTPARLPVAASPLAYGGGAAVLAPASRTTGVRMIGIVASTGGPNALSDVLSRLPADFPLPILITQHMPPIFTGLLAQRLSRDANRPCLEATDGMMIEPRRTYLAPGDYHMLVQSEEGHPFLRLSKAPPEHHVRPAADPMLRSIAAMYGPSALAVVLTGMGEDGKEGCKAVADRGGRVIAQDEATSVVWGMPGAVAMAGLANWVVPLPEIASRISALCERGIA